MAATRAAMFEGDWRCIECTWENEGKADVCCMCDTARGQGKAASPAHSTTCTEAGSAASSESEDAAPAVRKARLAQQAADRKLAERKKSEDERVAEQAKDAKAAEACARQQAQVRAAAAAAGLSEAPVFYLASSSDSWIPHEMVWSQVEGSYQCSVRLGDDGVSRLRVLIDGTHCKSFGNADGEWAISEEGANGSNYQVCLRLNSDSLPDTLTWSRFSVPDFSANVVRKYWIKGSWDHNGAHEMNWDPSRSCFYYQFCVGASACESFQICVNNAWHQCLYPEEEEGFFYRHALCGPDSFGHDKKWVVGKHALDAGAVGAWFEVRLRVHLDGSVQDVDWVRLTSPASGTSCSKTPR